MKKLLFLLGLSCGLASCDIETIVQQYERGWELELTNDFPELSTGIFSGLAVQEDGSILVIHEAIGGIGSQLRFISLNDEGELTNSNATIIPDYNIDVTFSRTSDRVYFLNSTVSSVTDRVIFSIDPSLSSEITPLSVGDRFDGLTLPHLGTEHFYLAGFVDGRLRNAVEKFDFEGNLIWQYDLEELSTLQILEGTEEVVSLLTIDGISNQFLITLNARGELLWKIQLNSDDGEIDRLQRASSIYGSPSNTISVVGTDEETDRLMALIDPRGDFLFRRSLRQFSANQLADLMVTEDGGFMLLFIGDDIENPTFFVIKLDHQGRQTWRQDYPFNNFSSSLKFVELANREVIILTGLGEVFQVIPD